MSWMTISRVKQIRLLDKLADNALSCIHTPNMYNIRGSLGLLQNFKRFQPVWIIFTYVSSSLELQQFW